MYDLVDVVDCDEEALQYMGALLRLLEIVLGPADDYLDLQSRRYHLDR